MLFTILLFIFNSSFAYNYQFSKFEPLKYFGNSNHIVHIQKAQSNTHTFYKTLSMFYKDYYEYGNTNNNVISSTKFKRPDLYSNSSTTLIEAFENFKNSLSHLQNESLLRLKSLELYKFPEISQLTGREQETYLNKKREVYLLAQKHVSLIQELYERSTPLFEVMEHLTKFETKINGESVSYQPLSEMKRKQLEKALSDLLLLERTILNIESSAINFQKVSEPIEFEYKKDLGKNFGFNNKSSFNEMNYKYVDRYLFEMYENIKTDIQVNNLADNRFVIKRYLNQFNRVIKNIEVILIFSHANIPEYEYHALRKLSEDLKQKSRRLNIEQSLYSVLGFMARYYRPEMNYQLATGNRCNILFQ